ncbi:MAG: RHS repeat-associated core domain-containing protein, partial [Pirellulaceae bacterium]
DNSYAMWDRFGRTIDLLWVKTAYSSSSCPTTDLVHLQYGYDRASNRLYKLDLAAACESENLDEAYTYDDVNRLIGFDRGDYGTSGISGTPSEEADWTLDPLGNWSGYVEKASGSTTLNQSRTANKANEITAISATTGANWLDPTYDVAGNMATGPKPSAESSTDGTEHRYTWDAWNRLVKVEERDYTSGTPGSWSDAGTYQYDAVNRRIVKVTSETRHFYYTNHWQCIEERVGTSSSARVQFIWGSRYVDDFVLGNWDSDSNGTLDTWYYGLQDANWNMVALVDETGAVLERYSYYPYGETTILDEDFSIDANGQSDLENPFLFTSRRMDHESGLYHYRVRPYSSALGVFQIRDPASYVVSGLNCTNYVDNSPSNFVDPAGLVAEATTSSCHSAQLHLSNFTFDFNAFATITISGSAGIDIGAKVCNTCCPGGHRVIDWEAGVSGYGSIQGRGGPWRKAIKDRAGRFSGEAWLGVLLSGGGEIAVSGSGASDKCRGISGALDFCAIGTANFSISGGAHGHIFWRSRGRQWGRARRRRWLFSVGGYITGTLSASVEKCYRCQVSAVDFPVITSCDAEKARVCFGLKFDFTLEFPLSSWTNFTVGLYEGRTCFDL